MLIENPIEVCYWYCKIIYVYISTIIIFKEFVYNWLRIDSKELKKYEKFPVGGLYLLTYSMEQGPS